MIMFFFTSIAAMLLGSTQVQNRQRPAQQSVGIMLVVLGGIIFVATGVALMAGYTP